MNVRNLRQFTADFTFFGDLRESTGPQGTYILIAYTF